MAFEMTARISSIAPMLAPVHGGIPLTVRRSGFGADPSAIDARLGGVGCEVTHTSKDGFVCNLLDRQDQYVSPHIDSPSLLTACPHPSSITCVLQTQVHCH